MSQPLLTNTSLLAEQLRHLLTIHNGRLPLANIKEIYVAEFGTPKDSKLAGMLDKNPLQIAPHTVNLTGHKWVVWAPTGRPYPPRGGKVSRLELSEPVDGGEKESSVSKLGEANVGSSVGEGLVGVATGDGADSRSVGNHKESANLVVTEDEDKCSQGATSGTPIVLAAKIGGLEATTPEASFITNEGPPSGEATNQTVTSIATASTIQSQSGLNSTVHSTSPKLTRPDPPSTSSNTQQQPKLDEMAIDPSSPYGFLSSALIAELIIHAKSLEELAANDLPTDDGTENPDFLAQYGSEFQEDRLKDGSGGELEGKDEPSTPPEKVDYLKKNMTPDEVLHEFRQLKERCGGYLDPEKMDPFLTYFGELSGRELERLESLKAKPSSSTKGAARRKQMMAIRFPSQSPAPPTDPFEEQRKKHMEEIEGIVQNLPVAPDLSNLSDSSDSEGSYPTPFARDEYVKKLLEKGLPKVLSSEKDGHKPSHKEEGLLKSSSDATHLQPANAASSEFSDTAEVPKPLLRIGSDVTIQPSVTSEPTFSPPSSELPSDWPLLPGTMEYDQLHSVKPNTPPRSAQDFVVP